jgi:hypothetical protein
VKTTPKPKPTKAPPLQPRNQQGQFQPTKPKRKA